MHRQIYGLVTSCAVTHRDINVCRNYVLGVVFLHQNTSQPRKGARAQ